MRGRTQFWLGSVTLAVVVGLLSGGLLTPQPAIGQEPLGAGAEAMRYSMVLGIAGSTERSQTLYLVDDLNDIFYVLEYSSKTRTIVPRKVTDLRRYSAEIIRKRARREANR